MTKRTPPYSPEVRERAVRMVFGGERERVLRRIDEFFKGITIT